MRNIKIVYAYDGSGFYGSQRQPNLRTVQGEVEDALNKLLGENINLATAGRTDKGVHAEMQVSNFVSNTQIPAEKIKIALDKLLPSDIYIINVEDVAVHFNARYDAICRKYKYIITSEKSPFNARYKYYIKDDLDIEKLGEIAKIFLGEHDFSNFMLTDAAYHNPVREITHIDIYQDNLDTIIKIKGKSFVKSQIRLIVGSMLEVYFGRKDIDTLIAEVDNSINTKKKTLVGPEGLYLAHIEYQEDT